MARLHAQPRVSSSEPVRLKLPRYINDFVTPDGTQKIAHASQSSKPYERSASHSQQPWQASES